MKVQGWLVVVLLSAPGAGFALQAPNGGVDPPECVVEARVESVGWATRMTSGLPELGMEGAPVEGLPFELVVRNGPPGGRGRLFVTLEDAAPGPARVWNPVFGAPLGDRFFTLNGFGESPPLLVQAPVAHELCGLSFVAKVVLLDPGIDGVGVTKGLRVRFGRARAGPLFVAGPPQPVGNNPLQIEVADLDGDQNPDVVLNSLRNGFGSGDAITVLFGNGDGGFRRTAVVPSGGLHPGRFALADLDGDGRMDIVSTDNSEAFVLMGLGGGEFDDPRPQGFEDAGAVALGDIDADGIPDMLLADQFGLDQIGVLLGVGDGTFLPAQTFPAGRDPISIALGDLDGDRVVDLVTGNRELDGFGTPGSVSVHLGRGDGTFSPPQTMSAGGSGSNFAQVLEVAIRDFDDDGRPDIAALLYQDTLRGYVAIFHGLGGGTFTPFVRHNVGPSAWDMAFADVDRDQVLDIVATNQGRAVVLLGTGQGRFSVAQRIPVGQGSAFGVATGDLDGDLIPEAVVFESGQSNQVRVLRNRLIR